MTLPDVDDELDEIVLELDDNPTTADDTDQEVADKKKVRGLVRRTKKQKKIIVDYFPTNAETATFFCAGCVWSYAVGSVCASGTLFATQRTPAAVVVDFRRLGVLLPCDAGVLRRHPTNADETDCHQQKSVDDELAGLFSLRDQCLFDQVHASSVCTVDWTILSVCCGANDENLAERSCVDDFFFLFVFLNNVFFFLNYSLA